MIDDGDDGSDSLHVSYYIINFMELVHYLFIFASVVNCISRIEWLTMTDGVNFLQRNNPQ